MSGLMCTELKLGLHARTAFERPWIAYTYCVCETGMVTWRSPRPMEAQAIGVHNAASEADATELERSHV